MEIIGFIGLGLIGGSIAKGLRRSNPNIHFIAYDTNTTALQQALEENTVDEIYTEIDSHMSKCDIIFLCAPVEYNISYLSILKPLVHPDCIITDVSSTKAEIHQAVAKLEMEDIFIGGHPMAGSEKSGFEHSTDHLVENAWYILSPTAKTSSAKLQRMIELVKSLKALPLTLDYQEHDRIVAAVSHVPHLIAAALVNLVKENDNDAEQMKLVAAGGFKDITRIASSSPVMWEQICNSNQAPIADMLQKYIQSLQDILDDVQSHNSKGIHDLFECSRDYRDSIPDKTKGALPMEYSFYCDIVDEAGAIATIATTLSTHQISIKNIGIIHNRMFEAGVLKIELYDKDSLEEAICLLQKWNYTIYRR